MGSLWRGDSSRRVVQAMQAFLADLKNNHPEITTITVALSGGPDSLALTAALAAVAPPLCVKAIIIDHQLQAHSATISAHALEQAQRLGVSATIIPVEVSGEAGMEANARLARYQALYQACGHSAVVLGHTLDDQAETVLLGLVRGSGTSSLSGMKSRLDITDILADEPKADAPLFFRPLLSVRRKDTWEACHEWQLSPHFDNHNVDPRYVRSVIRTVVIPTLCAELGAHIVPQLAKTGQILSDDAAYLHSVAEREFSRMILGNEGEIPVEELRDMPRSIQHRVISLWLAQHGLTAYFGHVESIAKLISNYQGQGGVAVPAAISSQGGRYMVNRVKIIDKAYLKIKKEGLP